MTNTYKIDVTKYNKYYYEISAFLDEQNNVQAKSEFYKCIEQVVEDVLKGHENGSGD